MLRAPGMDDLEIDPEDLKHCKEKEMVFKVLDFEVPLINLGGKCNEFVSKYITGIIKFTNYNVFRK